MNRHAREVLEFDAIVGELQEYCFSDFARHQLGIDFIEGETGFSRLAPDLASFKEAAGVLRSGLVKSGDPVSSRLDDAGRLLEALTKPGLVLELEELVILNRFVRSAIAIARQLKHLLDEGLADLSPAVKAQRTAGQNWLQSRISALPNLRPLEILLNRYLDEAGVLKEDQIPELRQARQRILGAQSELRKTAQSILTGKSDILTGEFATIRDGRMVIPLRADHKGRLPGIVHQSSATGATLFMEPFELVERNNACAEAESQWSIALVAVLRTLSTNLANAVPELVESASLLAELDQAWCRARYSALHDCWPAALAAEIRLDQARHPLLGKKAIPIDLAFGEGKCLMVISGPNTGGKTVALKTLGLFALMNQAGMDIPAALGSCLPLFSDIHADIGDEQSISQSLSTFSGHVTQISNILAVIDRGSLVLLDELGSGTDPEEGAALALSVTEELLARGALTLVTSHHGSMKALAYTHPGACNASMEFSNQELRPTYRVIQGIPGQSHALDIAGRVGLPLGVLERARAILGDRQSPLEELVRELGRQQQELRAELATVAGERQAIASREAALRLRQDELGQRELAVRQAQAGESSRFLREARSSVEAMLRELNAFRQGLDQAAADRLQELTQAMRSDLAGLAARQSADEAAIAHDQEALIRSRPVPDPSVLSPGAEVVITASNQRGILEREMKNGRWLVAVKGKNIEYRLDQIALPEQASAKPGSKHAAWTKPSWQVESGRNAVLQLDLRGMRAVEANDAIVRQIDAALVQGLESFGIIHGKGEGILQKTIHEYLKECPGVDRFEFARPEDGGFGKTNVFLRR